MREILSSDLEEEIEQENNIIEDKYFKDSINQGRLVLNDLQQDQSWVPALKRLVNTEQDIRSHSSEQISKITLAP